MSDSNPYQVPPDSNSASNLGGNPVSSEGARIWLGFLVAPLIVPILLSVGIVLGAPFYLESEDSGTPIGVIVLPLVIMSVGVVFAYIMMLMVGMPFVILLRSLGLLNLVWLNLVAVGLSCFLVLVACVISFLFEPVEVDVSDIIGDICYSICIMALPLTVTATGFWFVACRGRYVQAAIDTGSS